MNGIHDKFKEIAEEGGFYTADYLFTSKRVLNFSLSQRGSGKTVCFLLHLIAYALVSGRLVGLACRYNNDFDTTTNFDLVAKLLGLEGSIKILKGALYFEETQIGMLLPLNSADKYKKYDLSMIDYIFQDEFLTEGNKYLKNEPQRIMTFLITICRGGPPNDTQRSYVRWFCAANYCQLDNIYFDYFNLYQTIDREKIAQRGKTTAVAYEFTQGINKMDQEGSLFNLIQQSDYYNTAITGSWMISGDTDVITTYISAKKIKYNAAECMAWIDFVDYQYGLYPLIGTLHNRKVFLWTAAKKENLPERKMIKKTEINTLANRLKGTLIMYDSSLTKFNILRG